MMTRVAFSDGLEPQHLKQVSRIKHVILEKYLPTWEQVLGSRNQRMCYFDCFAGPGVYECDGKLVDGSPIIAVKAATSYLSERRGRKMTLMLVEQDDEQRVSLERQLERFQPYPSGLRVFVEPEDAVDFVPKLLQQVTNLAPSFFMVDPYGHPLTIPILNELLRRPRTETLINFMYYRINMDAGNPAVKHHVDEMFGDAEWRTKGFLAERGLRREEGFLTYFLSKLEARYKLQFRIRFDKEDRVRGKRTKYYLIHVSNHPKAALLMKEVMWPLGDEEGVFDFSGTRHGTLISRSPRDEELRDVLLRRYAGVEVAFDQIREETWNLPFIEKTYRAVIKRLKAEGLAAVTPVTSKTARGLQKLDLVRFDP